MRHPLVLAPLFASAVLFAALAPSPVRAGNGDAPAWMHTAAARPLPSYDDKTDAVVLYSEDVVTAQPNGKIRKTERVAIKILRPAGRRYGKIRFTYDPETKFTNIHGWTIPAQGKDYEIKEKDLTDQGYVPLESGALATDARSKEMVFPAADPGNVVGFETEQDWRPYVFQDTWDPQDEIPVRESRYSLQLPPSWEYKAVWANHLDVVPSTSNSLYSWSLTDISAVRQEQDMPPWRGVAARMVVSIFPPGATNKGFETWAQMGAWYTGLTQGRRDVTPDIHSQVVGLTASLDAPLPKMQALAKFLQKDIRYVEIGLGIGGYQPHPASFVYSHHFGDCKDKATLLSAMLADAGIDSYYVIINADRGAVDAATPPSVQNFNHAILAIRLPDGVPDDGAPAFIVHPKLGRLLFFDPTDTLTPFGFLRGELQANYGMLVTSDGGELVRLPQLPPAHGGIRRTAHLALDPHGDLTGDFLETRIGDSGTYQRYALRAVTKDEDRIKPIETIVSQSLGSYSFTKATVLNLEDTSQPFGYRYSVVARDYAKSAGNLLLVRPRVLGIYANGILEQKEPRKYPIEMAYPAQYIDSFDITLPAGYEVDDLPAPVDVDNSFASYHSKTEVKGNVLHYSRTYEVKQLTIPLDQMEGFRKFYRIVAGDEHSTAVLKPSANAQSVTH
jgi:Domain of Unknown Function with PDB structure (DUF3857)